MERIVTREELSSHLDGMLERAKRRTLMAPTSVVSSRNSIARFSIDC
jgi:hypothetical protein